MVFTTADGVVSMEEIQEHQLAEHKTEPNSGLGKAISYLLNHWLKLTLDNRRRGYRRPRSAWPPRKGRTARPKR